MGYFPHNILCSTNALTAHSEVEPPFGDARYTTKHAGRVPGSAAVMVLWWGWLLDFAKESASGRQLEARWGAVTAVTRTNRGIQMKHIQMRR
jgi:hypothetical protein